MKKLILICLLVFWSSSGYSQDRATGGGNIAILEVQFFPRMTRGKLDACELTYLLAFEDHVYRKGAMSFLRGSLVFMGFMNSPDKAPAVLFKATAFDLINDQPVLAPLEYAYLSVRGKSYAGKEFTLGQAEDGGLLVGYGSLENLSLSSEISENIQLNITRLNGRSDIAIPLSIMTVAPDKSIEFSKCSLELLDAVMNKFENN